MDILKLFLCGGTMTYLDENSIIYPETWTNMTPVANWPWTNYGGGYAPARYRRVNGIVYIEGLIAGLNSGGYLIFTMPEGYRPAMTIYSATTTGTQGEASNKLYGSGGLYSTDANSAFHSIEMSYVADQ